MAFIYLCNHQGLAWETRLLDRVIYDQTSQSDKHKQRLIEWAYKKKLIKSKDLYKGIWLTDKGKKFVEYKVSMEDKNAAVKMFDHCMMVAENE